MQHSQMPFTATGDMPDAFADTALDTASSDYNSLYNTDPPQPDILDSSTSMSALATAMLDILTVLCNQTVAGHNFTGYTDTTPGPDGTPNETLPAMDVSYILPWWRQLIWNILFGGMVIVATGGNLIVVWIVLTTKRMRTVTNYFIVNLSIADAMVSSLNVTFSYIYMLHNDWPFGEVYCKISQFIATLSICASVFTLMAISIDRYVAIMKPLQPRMSKSSNLAIAAAIWFASIVISCPMLLFFTTYELQTNYGNRTVCYSEWPDGATNHSEQEYIYNILFMILTYFLPIISMTVTYSRVGIELWGSKAIGEYTPRQVENVKSKRRVVKMMIVVVLIFAVCWLPFHAYFIITSCYPAITEMPFIQELYLVIYWLAMSNSMYNPIIYCWMNSRFRFGFKMFFRWCPFVHIGAETLNRRDNMTSRYSCSGSPDHNRIKRNDTQRSILYTCPNSPKSRRIAHCGMGRSSTVIAHRENVRHSMALGGATNHHNSYHQRCSLATAPSSAAVAARREILPLCSSGGQDFMLTQRGNNSLPLRNLKWASQQQQPVTTMTTAALALQSRTGNSSSGSICCDLPLDMTVPMVPTAAAATAAPLPTAALVAAAAVTVKAAYGENNSISNRAVTAAALMS